MNPLTPEIARTAQITCPYIFLFSLSFILLDIAFYKRMRMPEPKKDAVLFRLLIVLGVSMLGYSLCTIPKWIFAWSSPTAAKLVSLFVLSTTGAACIYFGKLFLSICRNRRESA